ncbi:glycosyltransferase family 87 protein [Tomitella biformata]|uniref:glycosyltransferase family 87 protein n=1 Tax=Tomitella biformata TaxID=630403 RepID=UPI0004674474|nr:glycosyltransferase family 87 protein [Tomitella biformata]
MQLLRFLPQTARSNSDVIKVVLWPIAVLTVIHRVFVLAVDGSRTNDFAPVYDAARRFIERLPIYVGNFDSVEPHYLYPPSGTLLISPIGLINYEWSRWAFISLNAIAVILAGYVLLRLFGFGLRSAAAPILLFAMFFTETVSNTLIFSNINGCILLLEVLFIALLLGNKQLWAGVPIGLAIAIKPTLAPLLLLPLLNKQWRPFVGAISIPVVLTALAWPLTVEPMDFVRRTVPYLMETRDYFNSAISGVGLYYGVNPVIVWILRLGFAALVLVSLYLLHRYYRHDQLFFLCTGSGLLLTATFLLTSLGQQYYSMLLFPLLMTVVLKNSLIRNWPAWVAGYLFLSFDSWYSTRFPVSGETFQYLRGTFGWGLLIIVMATVLINRYLVARAQGRLDGGIDPLWVAAPQAAPVQTAPSGTTVGS